MKYPKGTAAHEDLKAKTLDVLRKSGDLPIGSLQKRLGIPDANYEDMRDRVWKLNSALIGLQREKHVGHATVRGIRHYYAVSE